MFNCLWNTSLFFHRWNWNEIALYNSRLCSCKASSNTWNLAWKQCPEFWRVEIPLRKDGWCSSLRTTIHSDEAIWTLWESSMISQTRLRWGFILHSRTSPLLITCFAEPISPPCIFSGVNVEKIGTLYKSKSCSGILAGVTVDDLYVLMSDKLKYTQLSGNCV